MMDKKVIFTLKNGKVICADLSNEFSEEQHKEGIDLIIKENITILDLNIAGEEIESYQICVKENES